MTVWKMPIELGPLQWSLGRNAGGVTMEPGGSRSAAVEGE